MILENVVNLKYNKGIDKRIIKYAEFLKMTNIEEMLKAYKGDESYMAAIRRVEDLSTDPNFIGYYDVEEAHKQDLEDSKQTGIRIGIEKGISLGMEQGMEKGISQSKIEIAKNMLENNIDIQTILKCTGLSEEELEELKSFSTLFIML